MKEPVMLLKKLCYPINPTLYEFLERYDRISRVPISYDDLLNFAGSVVVYDNNDEDTLWIRVYYNEWDRAEIDLTLKKMYTLLHSDGNEETIQYLNVDAIDYCTFGNSKPFRVKVRNILNDNYVYFYIKRADASRIYGLELEHVLSPYRINCLVYKDTLVEEHISGIAGDVFIKEHLQNCTVLEQSQIAKEFVKFNERCKIRLLGDMRSYNYVVIPHHDFDQVVYRIRPIDFDQQCYEGSFKVYIPQLFKENAAMVRLINERLDERSIRQYENEERSILAKRMISSGNRLKSLLLIMGKDTVSTDDHLEKLKMELFRYTSDVNFKKSTSMGKVLHSAIDFITRNYKNSGVLSN